ncbi:unnamed protein product [Linum trigynum]|uniref:Uncharacterized protein n=1 Tax=Linum trigynum TaxID=586398 RepID=A0AAV2CX83_9ROSI
MSEAIRQYLMDRVVIKSEMFSKCTDTLAPRIRKRIERKKEEARLCVAKQTLNARVHNARTCPLNRGNGIQDARLNVADRRTIEREMRIATSGVGVYVNERTWDQYVRICFQNLNGARGRLVHGPQPIEVDLHGSQPPPSQP